MFFAVQQQLYVRHFRHDSQIVGRQGQGSRGPERVNLRGGRARLSRINAEDGMQGFGEADDVTFQCFNGADGLLRRMSGCGR